MNPPEEQGVLASGCPYCQVLYRGDSPCTRCSGQPRMQPAQMLDEPGVRDAVVRAVDRYDGTRAALGELLRVLFVYKPAAEAALLADGRLDLERLRRDDGELMRRDPRD